MNQFSKLSCLFLAILLLSGCRVTRQVNKSETQTESASKVDSSSRVNKDVTKESNIESVVTEVIDTTVQVNAKGEIVSDTTGQKTTSIKVRKTKTTKTHAKIKEVDKTHAKTEVKKKAEIKEEATIKGNVIEKTGFRFPWWLWLIIVMVVLAGIAWKARKLL